MSTARLLLASDAPEVTHQVSVLVQELQEVDLVEQVADPSRIGRVLQQQTVDVVLLHHSGGPVLTLEESTRLAAEHPQVAIVVLLDEVTPELLRKGMISGARDVLGQPLALEDLEASIRNAAGWSRTMRGRITSEAEAAQAGSRSGRVLAIAGSKGGVGTTTIAVHLALAAAKARTGDSEGDPSVCLVDLDLRAGDARVLLDISHRRSIVDLVDVADELSLRHLTETLFDHRSGIKVLLPPGEGELAEDVSVEAARHVLGALRTRFDLVIVDTGSAISDAAAAAIELAEAVIVVVTPDVPSIRGAHRSIELWQRLGISSKSTRVLVNRQSRRTDVQPDLIKRVVGQEVLDSTIPANYDAFQEPANTGMPQRLGDKKVLAAYRAVAEELSISEPPLDRAGPSEPLAGGGAKPGLFSRLAGEQGQVSVETMGILPIIIVVGIFMWQMALVGYTAIQAGNAARQGARAMAVSTSGPEAALADVPAAWRDGMRCADDDNRMRVSLAVPLLVPGVDTPIRLRSASGTSVESNAVAAPSKTDGDSFKSKGPKDDPCQEILREKRKDDADDRDDPDREGETSRAARG